MPSTANGALPYPLPTDPDDVAAYIKALADRLAVLLPASGAVGLTETQTLSGKTLASPTVTGTIAGTPVFSGPVKAPNLFFGQQAMSADASGNYRVTFGALASDPAQWLVSADVLDAFGNHQPIMITAYGAGVIFFGNNTYAPRTIALGTAIPNGTTVFFRILAMI